MGSHDEQNCFLALITMFDITTTNVREADMSCPHPLDHIAIWTAHHTIPSSNVAGAR